MRVRVATMGLRIHSSLFARISLGFIATFVAILAIQVVFFVYDVNRRDQNAEAEHATRLAATDRIGRELGAALETAPDLDLLRFVNSLEGNIVVLMKDGRVMGATDTALDVRGAIARLKAGLDDVPEAWRVGRAAASPVRVRGQLVGVVGSLPLSAWQASRDTVVRALGLVLLGSLVASLLIVRPVKTRLAELQEAARHVGAGDLTARAKAEGSDEISELSRTFNAMADELAARASALQISDRLRRQLMADVSHELMTPLTAVIGNLDTMLMPEVHLTERQRERTLTIAMREARRLERVIGDLLDAARLEAGGGTLTFETVPVVDLFVDFRERHERALHAKRLQLETRVEPADLVIDGDPFRLEQALENLIVNAIRHTPSGGTITVAARGGHDGVELTVSDSGEGIPPEHLPFVFDRFYKATSADGTASAGSGLGLSIVKAIVARHGGRVRATSEPGRGTTITMTLPLRQARPSSPAPVARAS
jgi:signal transduction histidine kinase